MLHQERQPKRLGGHMGLAAKVQNKNINQIISVSTVPRKQKAFLPDNSPFVMSFDIGLFPESTKVGMPYARIFISEEMPQYVLPEVHQLMIELAQNLKSTDIDSILNEMTKTGFILQFASMRDPWHGFKKLNNVFVIDMRQELADLVTARATKRLAKKMKQD